MAEEKVKIRIPKINAWRISTIILAVILLAQLLGFLNLTGMVPASSQAVGEKTMKYINENLVQGANASLVSSKQVGMYEIVTDYRGNNITVYVSNDGSNLYLIQTTFNMSQSMQTPPTSQTTQPAQQSEVPTVDLYVMSFCPYGVQAEQIMKPVVDLLGTKANIKVRFITNIQGNTADSIQSLHGANEAMEDLRQVCIMKYYDQKTYWNYLAEVDNNCPSYVQNAASLDTCWKAAANKTNIDVAKIANCSNSTEAINLMKADELLTSENGVSGSPTLIINGAVYSGQRASEDFKQAICAAFKTAPSECSQVITASGSINTSASGGCAT